MEGDQDPGATKVSVADLPTMVLVKFAGKRCKKRTSLAREERGTRGAVSPSDRRNTEIRIEQDREEQFVWEEQGGGGAEKKVRPHMALWRLAKGGTWVGNLL